MLVGLRSTNTVTTGLSIAFDMLLEAFRSRKIPHIVIDRSQGMEGRQIGALSLGGAIATLAMLTRFMTMLTRTDVVYIAIGTSSSGFLRDSLMIWPAYLSRKRIVLHLHGGGFHDFYRSSPKWMQILIRSTCDKADTIIVLGKLLHDQFSFVPHIEDKLAIVPNGLPDELKPDSTALKEISEQAPVRLLYLSNLVPSKGYLDVLEACRILAHERNVPIHCDFCGAFLTTVHEKNSGDASSEAGFLRLIREYQLDDIVTYHGTVRGTRKERMLRNAHIFLLPTYYPWEGQPISIIEALAFATPVVTTRYRGIPEEVIEGFNGLWVSPRSPHQIADAIEKLWSDPAAYRSLSQHALQHFQQHCTQDAHLKRLIPAILGESLPDTQQATPLLLPQCKAKSGQD